MLKNYLLLLALALFIFQLPAQDSLVNGKLIMVTNRVGDPLDTSYHEQKNKIMPAGTYRFLVYNKEPDTTCCTKITGLTDLQKMLELENDWVIYIHGYGRTFEEAAQRGLLIQDTYDVNLIVFSWPTSLNNKKGTKNLTHSMNTIEKSAETFENFLKEIQRYKSENNWPKQNKKLTLFLHSMGNYFIKYSIENKLFTDLNNDLFENVILNAAAVNQIAHPQWLNKLKIQNHIFVHSNTHDFILKGLRIFTKSGKQLGEKVELPVSSNANYVNFTNAIGMTIPHYDSHNYFVGKSVKESQNLHNYFYNLLHGKTVNFTNNKKFTKRDDGLGYDIIY